MNEIVLQSPSYMEAARETLSYQFFRGLVLSKNLLIQTISNFSLSLVSDYPAETQSQQASQEINDTFGSDFRASTTQMQKRGYSLYEPEFIETPNFQENTFSDSHQSEQNTAMQKSSEILQHEPVIINEVSQKFTYTFFKASAQENNLLCLPNKCQPEINCEVDIVLTSLPHQQAAYSSITKGVYNLAGDGIVFTTRENCLPQQIKFAFNQTVTQLPDYEQQQWQQTFFDTSYQLSLTASHSASITAVSLFAEDIALAYGYSPETAAWFATSARYTAQGAQMSYDIYQGADAITAFLPIVASNAMYYRLKYTTFYSNEIIAAISTATQYTARAMLSGFIPTVYSFFAATAGSFAGGWLEQKTADHLLANKLKENFQKRLEGFTEKTNTFYISLEELKAQGLEKIAENTHLQINPIIMDFYNQTADKEGIPNFALYRQLCHVEKIIDETNHKISSFDKVTSSTLG